MRLGKVKLSHEYTVDMEDEEMVREATDALYEDIMSAYKNDELGAWIHAEADSLADEGDIPDFLLENKIDREQVDSDIAED